jgi:hypothetical protein
VRMLVWCGTPAVRREKKTANCSAGGARRGRTIARERPPSAQRVHIPAI